MPDANEWINRLLTDIQARLEVEAKGAIIVPEQVADVLALFKAISEDTPASRGLTHLLLEVIREVHQAVFEQAVLGAAEIAAEIFEEEARP